MSVIEPNGNGNPMPNHKFITNPVNTHEVSKVLGMNSLDVGVLCSDGNRGTASQQAASYINRWAKYKPVVWGGVLADYNNEPYGLNTMGQWNGSTWYMPTGSDAASVKERYKGAWWKGKLGNCGITIRVFTDLVTMLDDWVDHPDWRNYWQYAPPMGGASEPYRLTDFVNYCHTHIGGEDFDKPIANWLMDSTQTQYRVGIDEWVIGGQAIIQKRLHGGDYLLSLEDIQIPVGAGLSSLSAMYFGVAFVRNYTQTAASHNREYAFVTSHYPFSTDVQGNDPNNEEGSSGLDLRMTPIFTMKTLGNIGDYMAFPFLSLNELANNTAGDPWRMTTRPDGFSGIFIPLPYFGRKITVERKEVKYQIILSFRTASLSSFSVYIRVKNVSDTAGTVVWNNISYFVDCYPLFTDGSTDYASGVHNDDVRLSQDWGAVDLAAGATSAQKTLTITPPASSSKGYFIQMNFHGTDVWDISDAVISYDYRT